MSDFDRLLETIEGREHFMNFLRSEFSDENLEFWLMVEKYKTMVLYKDSRTKKLAEQIYNDYVRPQGQRSVNISSNIQKDVVMNLKKFSLNLFDNAQNEIYSLMKSDCFPRFVNSKCADEFRKLQLVTPNFQRKKKKSRPYGMVVDCESPHKVRRRSLDFEAEVEEERPPVPKRRESLSLFALMDVRAPLARVQETCLDDDSYSTLVNPPTTTSNSSSLLRLREISVQLPNRKFAHLSVSNDFTFQDLIVKVCQENSLQMSSCRLIDSHSQKFVDLSHFIRDHDHSSSQFTLIKLVTFKVQFPEGISVTVECSSRQSVPEILQSILVHFGHHNVPEIVSRMFSNDVNPSQLAEHFDGQAVKLPANCNAEFIKFADLRNLSLESFLFKSIEFESHFFSKLSSHPAEVPPKEPQYSVPLRRSQRQQSAPLPEEPLSEKKNLQHEYVNTVQMRRPISYPSNRQILPEQQYPHPYSNADTLLEMSDDFFCNIMKENFVPLKTTDLVQKREPTIRKMKPVSSAASKDPGTPPPLPQSKHPRRSVLTPKNIFHRAKLAIVENSPLKRSSSMPTSQTYSRGNNEQGDRSSKPLPSIPIVQENSPQQVSRAARKETVVTPNVMKTLSKFHKFI